LRRQVRIPLAERLAVYFGLGDAARVDRVEVAWPSGRKQVVTQVRADATLRITEPR